MRLKQDHTYYAIGLMSGTSLDGVDVALLETDGEDTIIFKHATYHPYGKDFRKQLAMAARQDVPLTNILRIEKRLTEEHAKAVKALLKEAGEEAADIDVIGFHGQTIRHLPEEGLTWQMGNPSLLAELTGIPVVGDFRRRDMAAGGEGAPLVPLYHQALLRNQEKPCAILNLGGVANITWLGGGDKVMATDTGPGCGLLDKWAEEHTGQPQDTDGKLASNGKVDDEVIEKAFDRLPFFKKPIPRSADRYDFERVNIDHLTPQDGAATLSALTAEAVKRTAAQMPLVPKNVWVSGGGGNHPGIVKQLRERFDSVRSVEDIGLRADSMEAECFAWLAVRRMRQLPLSLPETTGCAHATSGGVMTA